MTPTVDACMEVMAITGSKKLTKRMVREIASSICSEKLPPGFPKELLGGMLQRSRTVSRSLRHCSNTKKSLIRGTDQNNRIHLLRNKNINIVTMPTRDVLLHHYRKT